MGSKLRPLKFLFLISSVCILMASCEDDPILAPKGQTTGGSYGRMSFPDSTIKAIISERENPQVF